MPLGPASYGLGFLAGVLSLLSPCVLPLLPIVAGAALAAHPWGPCMLALGLAGSFAAVGVAAATIGFAVGLDDEWFRHLAAGLLIAFGLILLSGSLQERFSRITASIGTRADRWLRRARVEGLGGQFIVGSLLGVVWAPCVGPTLGAAVTLASQGKNVGQVSLLMALFGIGAALPLALIGHIARGVLGALRPGLRQIGIYGRYVLGALLVLVGVGILTGWDRSVETFLVDSSPSWLIHLTTQY